MSGSFLISSQSMEKLEELKSKISNDELLDKINKDMLSKAGGLAKESGDKNSKVTHFPLRKWGKLGHLPDKKRGGAMPPRH